MIFFYLIFFIIFPSNGEFSGEIGKIENIAFLMKIYAGKKVRVYIFLYYMAHVRGDERFQ